VNMDRAKIRRLAQPDIGQTVSGVKTLFRFHIITVVAEWPKLVAQF
jgi:hypothetical protein